MKKAEYWQRIRRDIDQIDADTCNDRVLVEHYILPYWRANGVLPDDWGSGHGQWAEVVYAEVFKRQVFRHLIDVSEYSLKDDEKARLVSALIEIAQTLYQGEKWDNVFATSPYTLFSRVISERLRAPARAVFLKTSTTLTALCAEFLELHERGLDIALANLDLMAHLHEREWSWEEITATLKAKIDARYAPKQAQTDSNCAKRYTRAREVYEKDIAPFLVGRLMLLARTFAHWRELVEMSNDAAGQLLALVKMATCAKTADEWAEVYLVAKVQVQQCHSVMEMAIGAWRKACEKLSAEELCSLKYECEPQWLQSLILGKCEPHLSKYDIQIEEAQNYAPHLV